jgi:hypothetical protein
MEVFKMAIVSNFRESLDKASQISDRLDLGSNWGIAQYVYDFSVLGGAVGTITLTGEAMPDNALVHLAAIDSVTACTSGGSATLQLKLVGADDIKASTAVATFAANTVLVAVPVTATVSTWIKTTSPTQKVVLTVGAAALTAGVFYVNLFYCVTG